MKPQVVVVGSFVQDFTWKCAEFPQAGQTVIGSFITGPGGKGSNQAIAAGRAGARTIFIGALGVDVFAASAKAFYRAEAIDARLIEKPEHATGTAAILVNADGQNEIVVALGASAYLQARDVDAPLIRSAKIVVCQHEANLAVNAHVFRTARKAGVTTVLNPAPMRDDFDPQILGLVDILIPNETEFVALINRFTSSSNETRTTSTTTRLRSRHSPSKYANAPRAATKSALNEAQLAALDPSELHRLCRQLHVPVVILTLGARGCLVSTGEKFTYVPAHRGLKVVDTTGAGDAFVGGFAAGFIASNGDLTAAARHGNAVAGLSVTKFGTAPSMPTQPEIARFLRGQRRSKAQVVSAESETSAEKSSGAVRK